MPENITRCDYCDIPIDYGKHWTIEITCAASQEHDRWTLCRQCLRNNCVELANTIHDKTAKADY